MEKKMDSLFKKKLEAHSLSPREDAWTRVEATLPKKNNTFAWRIAAAILIAGALITVGVITLRKSDAPTLAKKSEPTKSIDSVSRKVAKAQSKLEEKKSLALDKRTSNNADEQKNRSSLKQNTHQEIISRKDAKTQSEIKTNETLSDFASLRETNETGIQKQNFKTEATTLAQTTSTPIEKPIKLEFTLEDVAVDHTAVAETETKNSGLKKMWTTALQIKNGEGPVNHLLEKKDELFALNFKKEKQKNQH